MKEKKPVLFILLFSGFILLIFLIMQPLEIRYGGKLISLLFPSGSIAIKERDLLLIIQAIMLLVVIPVYILTFIFSWKYRAHNPKGKYDPDLADQPIAETIWWGIPLVIIIAISILTAIRTYQLDPFRKIDPNKKSMTIQVVALQWKWLFIYPEEKIATLNFVHFPKDTPINFEITADAPMNSFWIPALGGQIYAMPKMKTKLHLIADKAGHFRGSSANISGVGFAGMHFIVEASSEEDYQKWLKREQDGSHAILNWEEYTKLARPSQNNPVAIYTLKEDNLFDKIIMKYMHPSGKNE